MKSLSINCPAKINIGLQIKNKRKDGFHNIRTIFHKICLKDEIILENSEKFKFNFVSDIKINDEDNIAFKAALGIKSIFKLEELPLKITINKKIPFGGGLAGGSANAAAVIRSMPSFLNLSGYEKELEDLALSLGSDVPFLIQSSDTSIATGRGEELEPIDFNLNYPLLLVFPGINVSTSEAYGLLNRTFDFKHPDEDIDYITAIASCADNPGDFDRYFKNDFEKPIFSKYPVLESIKDKLLRHGAVYAQMSGSGSTIFAVFEDLSTAQKARTELSDYKTHLCTD